MHFIDCAHISLDGHVTGQQHVMRAPSSTVMNPYPYMAHDCNCKVWEEVMKGLLESVFPTSFFQLFIGHLLLPFLLLIS